MKNNTKSESHRDLNLADKLQKYTQNILQPYVGEQITDQLKKTIIEKLMMDTEIRGAMFTSPKHIAVHHKESDSIFTLTI